MAAGWFDNFRRMLGWWNAEPDTLERSTLVAVETVWTAARRSRIAIARNRNTLSTAAERDTIGIARTRTTFATAAERGET